MRKWPLPFFVAIAVCTFLAGLGVPPASADTIQTFNVTATALCSIFDPGCSSTVSISGSFTLDLTTGQVSGGSLLLSDPADLKSSPLSVAFFEQTVSGPGLVTLLFFSANGSEAVLAFPFSAFPSPYSGGPLCTFSSLCSGFFGNVLLIPADLSTSPTFLAFGQSSGTVSLVPEPSTWLLLASGLLAIAPLGWRARKLPAALAR